MSAERVNAWCTGWPEMSRDEMVPWFTDDAVFENKPVDGAVTGGAAIADTLAGFRTTFSRLAVTMHHTVADGDLVLSERTEHFTTSAGDRFDLPVMGAFRFRDGKIAEWRDYWDMGTFQKGMGPRAGG